MTNHINTGLSTKPEYVILLGAGASCSEGAPRQSKLFNRAFKSDCHSRIDPSGHLKKYFRIFWGIDIEKDNLDSVIFPTFEEALGMLELARNRHEAFKKFYSDANSRNIDHTIEDLIYLIAEVLKTTLQNKNIHHTTLINNLKENDLLLQCCFVSLNYDILIDNALISAKDKCDIDYDVDFANFYYKSPNEYENWYRPDPEKAVKLLKIHGSLNWLYCPVCNRITITPKNKSVPEIAYVEREEKGLAVSCGICGGKFSPILIPPTYYKEMANYHLSHIWYQAEQKIRSCKKIFFCGYSLPDADMHLKYLLKRGVMNRIQEAPEIIIANNDIDKDDREKEKEELRYQRLFGKQIKYTEKSFKDFADNPIDLMKGKNEYS